jgi:tetratricopeptide (TPR) repeat protein
MRRVKQLLAVALVLGSTELALAQPLDKDQTKGRDLATAGLELYQKEQYAEALTKFKDAEKLYPTAQVLRMQGYTLVALKRYVEAIELLERAVKTEFKPLLPVDAEDTEDQIKEALKRIASLTIRSSVAKATVRVDDGDPRPLPQALRLAPGAHHFVVEAPNHDPIDLSRDIQVGTSVLQLDPTAKKVEPPPVAPPSQDDKDKEKDEARGRARDLFGGWFPQQRNLGLVLAGAGLAASGTALGLGIYGMNLESAVQTNIDAHRQNYDPACAQNTALCLADTALINHDAERAAAYRNTAMATGIAGAGLAVLGSLFVVFSPDGPFAPKKPDAAKPKAAELDFGCSFGVMSASCDGRF